MNNVRKGDAGLSAWRRLQDHIDPPLMPPELSGKKRIKSFAVNVLIFAVVSFLLLLRNQDHILFTGDLYRFFINMIKQMDKDPFFSQTANLLIYGNTDYGVNARLLPAFWLGSIAPEKFMVAAVYTGLSLELFAAVFIAVSLLRLPAPTTVLSAWTVGLAFMPYYWPYLVWIELSIIVPALYTASAVFILFAGVFFNLGKGDWRSSALSLSILVTLSVYAVAALPQYTVVFFFMLAWVCAGIFIVSLGWKESALKALAGLSVVGIFWALGLFNHIESLYGFNWAGLVAAESKGPPVGGIKLLNIQALIGDFDFYRAFHLARPEMPARVTRGFAVFSLASCGVLFLFFFNRRSSGVFKFTAIFLITLAGYLLWQWGYLEAVMAPLWAIAFSLGVVAICRAASALVARCAGGDSVASLGVDRLDSALRGFKEIAMARVPARFRRKLPVFDPFAQSNPRAVVWNQRIYSAVLGGLGLFVVIHLWISIPAWPSYRYGATPKGEIFPILERGIGLQESALFRGRLANIARTRPEPVMPDGRLYVYEAQQGLDHDLAFAKTGGADFRQTALASDIPTLFDVDRFISPGTVAVMNYFLTEEMHYKQRQFLYPSRFDARWMAFFGIRYVIHNELLPNAPSPIAIQDFGTYRLYLYEIADPNIGNYSPTEVVVAGSLAETLEVMADPAFDFRRNVIAERPFPNRLTAIASTRLEIDRATLVFRGVSGGWSLAVLPFEYSNCLRVTASEGFTGELPTLHRVNAHQIGLLFEREAAVRISFRFGPFDISNCRTKDAEDWRALDAPGASTFRGVSIYGGPGPAP